MKQFTLFSIILMFSVTGSVVGSSVDDGISNPQVGVVVGLNAPNNRYQLSREKNGKRVVGEVDLLMSLYEHDILWLNCLDSAATGNHEPMDVRVHMILQLAGGNKTITCEDSPYTLTKEVPYSMLTRFTGLLKNTVLSLFSGLNEQYQSKQYISLAARGDTDSLYMPLIGYSEARLAAGTRDLYLAWIGGYPPYDLRIFMESVKKPLIETNMLKEARLHIEKLHLKTGNYLLELKDARQQLLTRYIQVVALEDVPKLPRQTFGEIENTIDKQLHDTIYSAWLSEQDTPVWTLEAYQRIAEFAQNYYPAELLRLRFEGKL